MKVLFPASDWASNIGNPFFTLGVKHALEKACPGIEIIQTASNPIMAKGLKGRDEQMAFNYTPHFSNDIDAIMFAGPMFDRNFGRIFGPALRAAKKRNIKVFLVSAGSISYSQDEVDHCRSVLEECPPYLMFTRDDETHKAYGDLAEHSLSGICGAWFVSDYYPGYDTDDLKPYITSVFDTRAEAPISVLADAIDGKDMLDVPVYSGVFRSRLSRVMDRAAIETVSKHTIIRPCHRPTNPKFTVFSKPNTFVSYTPYGYLNLFRNSQVTVTDRLHAAVATLAFGNPAYLALRSNRAKLLTPVGLDYQFGKRMVLDQDRVGALKENLISFLKTSIGS